MKKTLGATVIVVGFLLLIFANINARSAPNISYLIGTYLPGWLLLIVGLVLRQEQPKPAGTTRRTAERWKEVHPSEFQKRASVGIGTGIGMMIMGSGLGREGPNILLIGIAVWLGGWALLVWGSVNYMRWKGYSGWFGLYGYLLLPGLLILLYLPNRRKRRLQRQESARILDALPVELRSAEYQYLLTLIPLGVLSLCVFGYLLMFRSSVSAAEWKEVASPELGFEALMPGTPQLEQTTQTTPAGNVELHKFSVEPKGKKELFMIVSIRFPEDVGRVLGGTEELLDLGRQDLLSASQGQLKSERPIVLDGHPGQELEVLPPKGAIIKARIYATKNQIYQVSVHVPKGRLASEDVEKFFDSFKLLAEPAAIADQPRD